MALLDDLRASFPWIDQIGLSPDFFRELVADSASGAEIITKLRQQPQYRARFKGLWREDGSIRMTEADYLRTEQQYRTLLARYGQPDGDVSGFFDGDVDPNELSDRLELFQRVKTSGRAVKDAFYVYAGMRLSDEDLYRATIDPSARDQMTSSYNQAVSSSKFDYTTWITRATEVGLERVAEALGESQKAGALTGQAVQSVLRTDPTFARTIMDAIYTAGTPGQQQPGLALEELLSAFEYAAIGAAATQAGLALPSKERIAEIRAAGVDRARAANAYTQFGQQRGVIDAATQRVGEGRFDQARFENAAMLGGAADAAALQRAMAREEAAGESSGAFRFDMDRSGRLVQQGMRTPG